MNRAGWLIVVMLAMALSCSKQATVPLAPQPGPSSSLVDSVAPLPRATRVFEDAEIWAHFTEALDSLTVSDTSVFLKIDTRRQPVSVRWDRTLRRVRIVPSTELELGVTYTVELTEKLRSASGAPLTGGYRWQFTILSLRRLTTPQPADRATGESPVAALSWNGTESAAGVVRYDLRAGVDSTEVAERRGPALARTAATYWVPDQRWRQDAPNFWSITAVNQTTGETLDGPVWRFEPLAASTPVDSMVAGVRYWYSSTNFAFSCGALVFRTTARTAGTGNTSAIRWDLRGFDAGLRLAGSRIELGATPSSQSLLPGAAVSAATSTSEFHICDPDYSGPFRLFATVGTALAVGTQASPTTLNLTSDALAAHLEASVRLPGLPLYGYTLSSIPAIDWIPPGATWSSPTRLVLYVYRTGTLSTH